MSIQACCSHSKVEHKIIHHPGGTKSERWTCSDCDTNFWPEGADMHIRKRRDNFAAAALQGWAAGRNNGDAFGERSSSSLEFVAESCFKYADAMLKESEKSK